MLRFENDAVRTLEAHWAVTGRKMHFAVTSTKGAHELNMARMDAMRLFLCGSWPRSERFVESSAGLTDPDSAAFCPGPQHQLNFNQIKAIEVAHMMQALAGGERFEPDGRKLAEVQRTIEAILPSAREHAGSGQTLVQSPALGSLGPRARGVRVVEVAA